MNLKRWLCNWANFSIASASQRVSSSRYGQKLCLQSSSNMPSMSGIVRTLSDASAGFSFAQRSSCPKQIPGQQVKHLHDCSPEIDASKEMSAATPGSANSPGRKCESKTRNAKDVVIGLACSGVDQW